MVWFEWDEAKAKSNERKHGIRFEDAMLVFADPYALAAQDRMEDGELRWQTLGLAGGIVLLLVAHTVRNEGEDENHSYYFCPKGVAQGAYQVWPES